MTPAIIAQLGAGPSGTAGQRATLTLHTIIVNALAP
jgi:hypothetical protein